MKVIVVSGARSNVGKTQLSRALAELFPDCVRIKIGHHQKKPGRDENLYPIGISFQTIALEHTNARYFLIESNQILKEITPECVIYLPADNPKPSARLAAQKADLVRGTSVSAERVALLAERLECGEATVRKMAALAGTLLDEPDPATNSPRCLGLLNARTPAAARPGLRL